MIDFRALGGIELRRHDGASLRAVHSQPKRQAVLSYLALAAPRGFHRRDTILGMIWPDRDESGARAALNKAVHHLREALGASVVVSRGHEELGLDWQHVWCDAAAFDDALARGELAAALKLYRGDLMPGFFLQDAPEFERWLERERARLRERAVQAARTLAEREEAAGQLVDAAGWVRRELELSPHDESAARRLMQLVARISGRGAAIGVYDEFAHRLKADLALEPSAETTALRDSLRMPDSTPARAQHAVRTGAEDIGSSRVGADAAQAAPRSRPRWWRRRPVLVTAGVLIAAVAWPLWRGIQASSSHAAARLVVLPFLADSASEAQATAVAAGLRSALDRSPELDVVTSRLVRSSAGAAESDEGDVILARSIAMQSRARLVVTGQVTVSDGRISIQASLFDTSAGRPALMKGAVAGELADLPRLTETLARQFLAGDPARGELLIPSVRFRSTESAAALDAYLAGEDAYEAGRFSAAAVSLRRAVEIDTAYALAYLRLSKAANWIGDWEVTRWAIVRALRHADRLAPIDRLRARAWDEYTTGGATVAAELLRTVLVNWPADDDSWMTLGEVLFHWGPSLGWPQWEAREAFERGLALAPTDINALMHLARLAAVTSDAAFGSLSTRAEALELDSIQRIELRALRAFSTTGSRASRERVVRELNASSERVSYSVAARTAVYAASTERGRVLDALAGPTRTPGTHTFAALLRAQLAAARGRLAEASAELRDNAAVPPKRSLEYHVALSTLPAPFPPASPAELRRLLQELNGRSGSAIGPGTDYLAVDAIYAPRRKYLVALLTARLGDHDAALRLARDLEGKAGVNGWEELFGRDLSRIIRAEVHRARGQPEVALEALGAARVRPDLVFPNLLSYSVGYERFLRAELLREVGRDREALRWYGTFPDAGGYDLMFLGPALLRSAEIHDRRGDTVAARDHYSRVVTLWADAEPALQPFVTAARSRLNELAAQ